MLKAILIDDEPDSIRLLALQLKAHCPQVEITGQYTSSLDGLQAIRSLKPDLVFLDVEMPEMNGFELLDQLDDIFFFLSLASWLKQLVGKFHNKKISVPKQIIFFILKSFR